MRFDAVQTIKDRLAMQDVLSRYGYEPKRRMRCPLHNGDGLNFEVKERSFMCYSQCGGGDVISFVQKLFNLSFTDTLKKIDNDFGLNLYKNKNFQDFRKSYYKGKQVQSQRNREKTEKEQIETEYWERYKEWQRFLENKEKYAPKNPNEEIHPLFLEAVQKIEYQKYLLDCAESRRNGE